jgi:DNA excision repair protein ERCC-3
LRCGKCFNYRARSGIIVLPCGAGKSLTGIGAACRINKSVLVLCTNSVSVDQWKEQFEKWTNIKSKQMQRFTLERKEALSSKASVSITTYHMIAYSRKRSAESIKIINQIKSREWSLVILDEVHVVPAQMFRTVVGIIKAHCKLGLTATLVREDELILDLNFLIGPKIYEANWLDLTIEGHIANVSCSEVWCPMTEEFYSKYLSQRNEFYARLLYIMNPTKIYNFHKILILHEKAQHKIIVFSDSIFALHAYACKFNKSYICGTTPYAERARILEAFRSTGAQAINTVFLSKVGDNSIDVAEARVLIQLSSQGGSRRQEAQRFGRILRNKNDCMKSNSFLTNIFTSNNSKFGAFFYTLVTTDSAELFQGIKRQRFLLDQGYSYKVITNLFDQTDKGLYFISKKEQKKLIEVMNDISN